MALKWYNCNKCGTAITNGSSPDSLGCPSGGYHNWYELGTVGNTNYCCRKCGITVQTQSSPSSAYCPRGGYHDWNRL